MKVHELDEAYKASKEQVKAALEAAGLSTHHSSKLDEGELSRFESAFYQMEKEAPAEDGPPREGIELPADGVTREVDLETGEITLFSPFKPGLFRNKDSEAEAIRQLAGRQVAWAHRRGSIHVRFLALPDGQTIEVRDE